MFSAFGSTINEDFENGLIETFANHNKKTAGLNNLNNLENLSNPNSLLNSNNKCMDINGTKYCQVNNNKDSEETTTEKTTTEEDEESETEDDEETEAINEEEAYNEEEPINEEPINEKEDNTPSPTTGASSNKDVDEEDEEDLGVDDVTEGVEDDDGEEDVENFVGYHKNNPVIEGFSSQNVAKKAMCPNLLLKSVLFACLFYILAHTDSRNFVVNVVFKQVKHVRKQHYIYIATFLFLLIFYVISIFL